MTTTPTEPTYKDAKAQAKAAKAYAKAQRPFYKKKRVIIPAAILGVAVLSQAASGGESGSEAKAVSDKGAASAAKDAGSAPKDAGSSQDTFEVGQAVELEGTQYTVTGVSTQGNIGGQFGENADGEFVVVDLTIENKKDETKTFLDSAATFHAGDGTSYQGSNAAIYLGDDSLFLREMQPDLPTKGKLVFDLPPAKIAGGVLVVEDLFGGGEARIDLGLK